MTTVVLALRLVLAAVFLTASVGKLLDLPGSRRAMQDFGVPFRAAGALGLLLPLIELATAVGLIIRPTATAAAVAALVLLLAFMAGIANALRLGTTPDCHCFGQIQSSPAGRGTLLRNAVLAAMAGVVIGWGSGPAVDAWVGDRTSAELLAILAGVAAILLAGFAFQLRRRLKDTTAELGLAQRMAAVMAPGIPIGTPAPDFSLRRLNGEQVTLDELLAHGRPTLLTFVSPNCGSCAELLPKMARWERTLSDRLTVALISSGGVEDNKLMIAGSGVDEVLLQDQAELIEAYRIRGTPSAVLVSPAGAIASAPAESVSGIEPLIRLALRGGAGDVLVGSLA